MRAGSLASLLFFSLVLVAGFITVESASWSTAAIVMGGLLWILFVIWRPRTALTWSFSLVLIASTPFRYRDPLAPALDTQVMFELAIYAGVAFVVLVNFLRPSPGNGSLRFHFTSIETVLFGYICLAAASTLWSAAGLVTAVRAIQLSILFALCFASVRILGPIRTLQTFAVAVGAYVLVATSLAAIFPAVARGGARFSWFALHPIMAGSYAATAAILALAGATFASGLHLRRLTRLFLWMALVPLLIVLVATHSRGPLFAFTVGAAAVLARKHLPPWTAGVAVCLVLGAGTLGLMNVIQAYTYGGPGSTADSSIASYVLRGQSEQGFLGLSGRVDLWDYIYTLVRQRPLFGYGYAASPNLLLDRFPWAGEAHGALPESLLDLGIVGAALLSFALLRPLMGVFFAEVPPDRPVAWARAAILGCLTFLLIESFNEQEIAGVPDYPVLLFFLFVMAYSHLSHASASVARERHRARVRGIVGPLPGQQTQA